MPVYSIAVYAQGSGIVKNQIIVGIIIIALGLLLAAGTQIIFCVCGVCGESGEMGNSMSGSHSGAMDNNMGGGMNNDGSTANTSKMKCYWTGRAEIGIGGTITVIGILFLIFKDRLIRTGLSLALIPVGVYALLVPHVLIGVCGSAHMTCRTLALPAITIISVAVSIIAIVNVWWLKKIDKEGNRNGA